MAAKIIYVGAFLDDSEKAKLLARFAPVHPRVFAHHMTMVFKPAPDHPVFARLGEWVDVEVFATAEDAKGQAVCVRGVESDNPNPHITISCAEGTAPVYSNDLLRAGSTPVEPLVLRARILAMTTAGSAVAVVP